jgi:hypothetical protein
MDQIFGPIRQLFTPVKPLPAGMYHYQAPPEDPRNYRLHLRVEPDGTGVLVINAATVLHLNQSATEYAYHLLQQTSPEEVARVMSSRFQVSRKEAMQDYQFLRERVEALVTTPDLDPVTFLDFERLAPHSGAISAPYRLDCAVTYRLPSDEPAESAPLDRAESELSTAEWKAILDKAWAIGIPHIVFTGGEPTLRADLPALISRAEANGQITGLLTDGLRLADPAYLQELLQTGLDHAMLVLQPDKELAWTALQNALAADLFVAVHLTVTPENLDENEALLDRLAGLGVKAASLTASAPELGGALIRLRDHLADLHMDLVWDLPVPYSANHPVALESEEEVHVEGAGRAWLYVEPDGDVLPAQGINQVLGNLLHDPWEQIWKPE